MSYYRTKVCRACGTNKAERNYGGLCLDCYELEAREHALALDATEEDFRHFMSLDEEDRWRALRDAIREMRDV